MRKSPLVEASAASNSTSFTFGRDLRSVWSASHWKSTNVSRAI
uniref:Uncharacterized protein n=1 Tax=Anguilla anguilla TaxID=7936 RepID=A0A0E9R935_ANGAN